MSSSSVESAVEYLTNQEGFTCSEVLGKGTYGSVIKISTRDNGQMAAKIVENSVVNVLEIKEWPRLRHHNVLQVADIFLGLDGVVIFVTDLMQTNLFQRLRDKTFRNDKQAPDKCRLYARQVLSGLAYLHRSGLCHLDLRAENVLIAFDGRAVVADFSGMCRSEDLKKFCPLPTSLRPPEMLEVKKRRVSPTPVDLWAYGLLVTHLYLGKGYHECTIKSSKSGTTENCWRYMSYFSNQSYLENSFHETYPNSAVSVVRIKELMSFIQLFLQMNPEQRTKAEDALASGFLNAPFYRTAEPSSSRLATSHTALLVQHEDESKEAASAEESVANDDKAGEEDMADKATKKKKHWFRIGRMKIHMPSIFTSDKSKSDEKTEESNANKDVAVDEDMVGRVTKKKRWLKVGRKKINKPSISR